MGRGFKMIEGECQFCPAPMAALDVHGREQARGEREGGRTLGAARVVLEEVGHVEHLAVDANLHGAGDV